MWPSDSAEGKMWRTATEEAKASWRRAYERRPARPAERALQVLEPALEALAERAEKAKEERAA